MAKTQTIKVKTDEKNPEPVELIAKAIIDVSKAFRQIGKGGLNKRAIVLLLHDMVKNKGVGINQIEVILDAAPKLESHYVTLLPKKGGKQK